MRVAAHYKNVVYQFNQEHHESLQKSNEKGQNWPFKFPRMVQSEFHVSEPLSESILDVNMEYKATAESGQNDRGTHRLHIEVEELIQQD